MPVLLKLAATQTPPRPLPDMRASLFSELKRTIAVETLLQFSSVEMITNQQYHMDTVYTY